MAQALLVEEAAAAVASQRAERSLSERFWGLDWKQHLPWQFDDVRIEAGTLAEALPFIQEQVSRAFVPTGARFLEDPLTPSKQRFLEASDVFLFRVETRIVGLLMANPIDWSTYYMRSSVFLPEFQARGLLRFCVEKTYEPLRAAGCERIEGETSPTNAIMARALLGMGFIVTSTVNSDRWGAMLRFTKFLREEGESVFARQFCAATNPIPRITDPPTKGEPK